MIMLAIAHCKNMRGLSMNVFRLFEKLNIQMKDQLNLRVLSKNRSIRGGKWQNDSSCMEGLYGC